MNDTTSENGASSSLEQRGSIYVNVFGRTDVGLVRDHNEDNFLVADLTAGNRSIKPEVRRHEVGPNGSIFVVCDGMGGAAAGEVASQIGVDTIYKLMQRANEAPSGDEQLAEWLNEAITEAGQRIHAAAKMNRKQRGMGTTVTAAVLSGQRLILGQVGDSRAYILRGEDFVQVTKDQSLVQQLIDAKQLTAEEAKEFDRNNIILQALGTSESVHVDMTSVTLRRGDVLLMCSDGLSGMVDDEVIYSALKNEPDPMEACRLLTDLACEGGGHDNITVIVAEFDGDGLKEPLDSDEITYEKFAYSEESSAPHDDAPITVRQSDRNVEFLSHSNLSEQEEPQERVETGKRSWVIRVALALIAVLLAGYWVFFSETEDSHVMVNAPVGISGDGTLPESNVTEVKDGPDKAGSPPVLSSPSVATPPSDTGTEGALHEARESILGTGQGRLDSDGSVSDRGGASDLESVGTAVDTEETDSVDTKALTGKESGFTDAGAAVEKVARKKNKKRGKKKVIFASEAKTPEQEETPAVEPAPEKKETESQKKTGSERIDVNPFE